MAQDWSDLPDGPYATLRTTNGPSHIKNDDLRLGACIDTEANGQPNAGATGDNQNIDVLSYGLRTPAEMEGLAEADVIRRLLRLAINNPPTEDRPTDGWPILGARPSSNGGSQAS